MRSPLVEPGTESSPVPETSPDPPERNGNGRSRWLIAVLLLLLLILSLSTFMWLKSRRNPPVSDGAASSQGAAGSNLMRLKGTTQAVHTRSIQAPVLEGEKEGTLTIISLRPAGSRVKKGDILAEFDRQAQQRDFLDKQAQNDKLTDDVLQEQAKENAARAKDETEIKQAEGDLSKAQLEIQKLELMSRIDAEKARENLEEAKATLDQLKETFSLKRKAAAASIRIVEIQRDRARETMTHAQANAANMQIHSPLDGVIVLNSIWKQGNIGEVQEGDQVRPGVPFMQVVDPSAMEVQVSLNQQDVLGLHEGAKAKMHLDAYPDLVCPAQLEVMDPMGKNGDFSAKVRSYSTLWSVSCTDPRLLPGLSAAVDVEPEATPRVAQTR